MNDVYASRWAAAADDELTVYVPKSKAARALIAPKSAVVGRPAGPGRIEVCYEGNLHNAANLTRFSERVACAAGTLVTGYPTIARAVLDESDVAPVGTFVPRTSRLHLIDVPTLETWLPYEEAR